MAQTAVVHALLGLQEQSEQVLDVRGLENHAVDAEHVGRMGQVLGHLGKREPAVDHYGKRP